MVGRGVLTDVVFLDNQSAHGGGGLEGGGDLTNVTFQGNSAFMGGAMYDYVGGSTLTNVSFHDNQAPVASALYVGDEPAPAPAHVVPDPTKLINVTVSWLQESADPPEYAGQYSAIAARLGDVDVFNSIVWSGGREPGSALPIVVDGADLRVSHSLLEDCGGSGASWNPDFGTDLGGNLGVNPMFLDLANGDLRLDPGSPAVDAGDTGAVPEGVTTDLAGNARFMGMAVDMGAYETEGPLSIANPGPPASPSRERYLYAAPNPFNPTTTIYYGVAKSGPITLTIYDLAGRKVKTLVSEYVTVGDHEARWDGRDEGGKRVASGVYLYRLNTDQLVETKRMVLVK
jgi:predicted outer membrane repeat protein